MTNYSHASDCSLHNEPASPNGPCDCMNVQDLAHALNAVLWVAEEWYEHNGSAATCAEGHLAAIEHAKVMSSAALDASATGMVHFPKAAVPQ